MDDLPSSAVAMLMMLARPLRASGRGVAALRRRPTRLAWRLEALKFESVVAWYPDQQAAFADPWD